MRLVSVAVLAAVLCAAPIASAAADPKTAPTSAQAPSAAQAAAAEKAERDRMIAVLKSLHPQTGAVSVPGTDAKLQMGDRYYFLDSADARKVLVDLWGNRPEEVSNVLGMFIAKGQNAVDAPWGAVVTWKGDGFVSDKDAKKTDYAKLLKDMQASDAEDNKERTKAGFSTISVVGWAQTPVYDSSHHTLIWARELAVSDRTQHTLNYDIRVLGRKGVLSLNVVGGMKDLKDIQTIADSVRDTVAFDPGFRYQDYKDGDKRAAYGVAGLLAAGVGLAVAKKAGLLGVILLFGKKFIVLILAAFGGAGAWISRQWKKITGRRRDPSDVG
jgi:uncharacterized membrane-anchored protein